MNPRTKICDKKYKLAELKVSKIISKIETLKLSNSFIAKLGVHKRNDSCSLDARRFKLYTILAIILSSLLFGVWCYHWVMTKVEYEFEGRAAGEDFTNTRQAIAISAEAYIVLFSKECRNCVLELPSSTKALFRPAEDCTMCVGVETISRVSNISAQEFEERFAYKATPVIVTDAMKGWKAVEKFNFNFFANFYQGGKMGRQTNDCFYFAYKSGLNSLNEVFSMDEKRANLSGEPWYVGWSTCYDEETRKLRSYYNRPYFLPKTAESDMVDWIFMGGPGQGAHMHVDSVRHMSWQAQVRGHKRWQLAPPPECLYRCPWITFTVAPGEILVVNTNRWYHKTTVLPGDISITIGAEYD